MNRVSPSIVHASQSTASRFNPSRFTASRLTAFRSITSRSTASIYSSNGDWSWPPSISPNLLNYGVPLHLWVNTALASNCISKLVQLQSPNLSPNSLDDGHQVCTIITFSCISEFTESLGLQVDLQSRSIWAAKCMSEVNQSWDPSACSNMLDHGLQAHLSEAIAVVQWDRGNGVGQSEGLYVFGRPWCR